jgi:plastocyanin
MQSKKVLIGAGIVIVALVLVGYYFGASRGSKQEAQNQTVTPMITPTPSPATQQVQDQDKETNEVREIVVEAKEYTYSLEKISIKKGIKVKLTLTNNGRMSHDFVVENTQVATPLAGAGKSVSIEFSLDEAGTYNFYCSIGNHRALGMAGILEVIE